MEKLRSLTSATTGKVKGVFSRDKGDNLHSVLQKPRRLRGGDPFVDGPLLEEHSCPHRKKKLELIRLQPTIPKSHIWIHLATLFFTFLAVCTLGATAGFQARWFAVSGGTGFSIFITLLNFFLTTFLLGVPLIYGRWDRLKRPAQFLQQARVVLILHIFGTITGLIGAMIVTISALTAPGCKNAADDPHASLGDDFKNGLGQWCTTKRACAVFLWLGVAGWLALTALAALSFRRERKREPSFIPPSSPTPGYAHLSNLEGEDEPKSEVHTDISLASDRRSQAVDERDVGLYNDPRRGTDRYEGRLEPAQSPGETFPLGTPAAEPSRTMRMAYSDPYAHVRASLLQSANQPQPHQQQSHFPPQPVPTPIPQTPHHQQYSSHYQPPPQPYAHQGYHGQYQGQNGHLPAPPTYSGYQ